VAAGQATGSTEVRRLISLEELDEAVRLQKEIWGFEDIELLPLRLFVVAQKVGGQTLGAFDGDRMVGFLLSIPGLKHGQMYLHSHMMGVRSEYRNSGLGRTMKLMQRLDAIERGIHLVQWTFDPLELKNAYFNIERLGAIVRLCVLNQYGTTTSHLHGGLPTDRCVAEWHLLHDRVVALLEGRPRPPAEVTRRIEVPADIARIRAEEPRLAREIQARVSELFVRYTGEGLAVTGFEKSAEKGTYLLGPWDSK
jgi:predicted GNAT superfamily acetyltransferase